MTNCGLGGGVTVSTGVGAGVSIGVVAGAALGKGGAVFGMAVGESLGLDVAGNDAPAGMILMTGWISHAVCRHGL